MIQGEIWTATCTRAQAEQLLPFDHHRVWVRGRLGIMLTYPWMLLPELV